MARFGERRGFGGRRFGGPRDDMPKPVNAGEEYDVEISEVGTRGDGIARVKNFVVFIADTKKGEKTRIKIKEVRDRFAIGEKVGGATEGAAEPAAASGEVELKEPAEEVETEETEEAEEEE
jgi:predicted RNA-binding protein with TRAM domain